jgi:2-polyprenyl-3-methyl-5-hydroxy-6-metoxy-1,4-benzoquinol methylase
VNKLNSSLFNDEIKIKLESINVCPCCDSKNNKIFVESVKDVLFKSSEIDWLVRQCQDCNSLYLGNRYQEEMIGLAYTSYYTHDLSEHLSISKKFSAWIKDAIFRSYIYLLCYSKLIKFIDKVIFSSVKLRIFLNELDRKRRFLAPTNDRKILLDIGCGNGEFLTIAKQLGYIAWGVEPDKKAYGVAKHLGDNVICGSIDSLTTKDIKFDVITISHVLEHVYDIDNLLYKCEALLNNEGAIYIEYPNPYSYCCELFKSNWRGLEPPRHIALPSYDALNKIFTRNGLKVRRRYSSISAAKYMIRQSIEISEKNGKIFAADKYSKLNESISKSDYIINFDQHEFITVEVIRASNVSR